MVRPSRLGCGQPRERGRLSAKVPARGSDAGGNMAPSETRQPTSRVTRVHARNFI
jgi:hypothetical protein